ncbi:MAG: succinic semialdehyde dehydrogenase [Solirubrobacteraceae bacterium]
MTTKQPPAGAQETDGERKETSVENPATGEVVGRVPSLSGDEVTRIVARARAAQPGWEALGFEGRGRILRRAQKWVTDNDERIIETIVSETGKTYEDAQLAEITYAANAFGFWAKMAPELLADEKVKSVSFLVKGRKLLVRYAPAGVVGVIGPWNFPLTNSFGDCIPALAAGNAVVLKPAEITPLTSLLMAEMLDECGAPGDVFQVVTGKGSLLGPALIDAVDVVMFTGSTETGKRVMARAAETITPVYLELGGKDPMIVLSDADVERAANAAAYYSMNNTGQVCISVERVYVEEPLYDEFVDKVTEKVRKIRQGVPGEAGKVDVGSLTYPPQLDIVEEHVSDAVQKGAKVLTGGRRGPGEGLFFEPTVLVDVDHSMKAMTEETFGPTLPIMKVRDSEEALRLANDSPFGLQASVWTKDLARGEALARRVEAGAVCVNDAQINYAAVELPMGGWKLSGMGSRHGAGGIRKYTRQQTILVTRFALKKDIHMFPYGRGKTKMLGRLFKMLYGRGERD